MQQNLATVDKEIFERVWKVIEEIGTQERHFNGLQSHYRSMASAWLLAVFSAIGFVVSETIQVGVPREPLVAGIAAAGCLGTVFLWVLDLLVYHRLLDACFIEGLILEEQYAWLPPVRHNMLLTQQGQGVLFRVVGFYLLQTVLLILIAGAALALWWYQTQWLLALAALLVSILLAVVVGRGVYVRTENTDMLRRCLEQARSALQ